MGRSAARSPRGRSSRRGSPRRRRLPRAGRARAPPSADGRGDSSRDGTRTRCRGRKPKGAVPRWRILPSCYPGYGENVAVKTNGGGNRLVIVESPAKARTISGYLGDGYTVASSIGHIRDLPNRAHEIPPEIKKEPWARLGVNVEEDFAPVYVVDANKKDVVSDLKKRLKEADELLLATDEDREGEAIAWHLLEVLKPQIPVRRMVFHEITPEAIQRSLEHTREIDDRLVDAQETRRILDRLYGYEVSPVLWKKVTQGLSAGRVQSVATRLIVERERERIAFVEVSYWDLEGVFDPGTFGARLVGLDGKRVAHGRDFGADGKLANADA